jgi:hypothetical protein
VDKFIYLKLLKIARVPVYCEIYFGYSLTFPFPLVRR